MKGNLLIAYHKNIDNHLDLKNYLYYKSINVWDIFRSVYYSVYIKLRLTNWYRYDHIIRKPDFIYEYEKLKMAMNLANKSDKNKI